MRIFPNFIFNQIIPLIRILSAAQSRSCHLEGDSIKIDIPIWRAVKGLRIFCGWESTMPPHRSPRCYTHNGASSLLYTVSATLRALHITLYQINSAGICMTQWILKGKWQVRRTGSKFSIPCIDKSLNPLLRLARSMYNTTLFFFLLVAFSFSPCSLNLVYLLLNTYPRSVLLSVADLRTVMEGEGESVWIWSFWESTERVIWLGLIAVSDDCLRLRLSFVLYIYSWYIRSCVG